jgi:hypothetical protein
MPIIVPSGRDNENPTLTLDDVFGGPLSDLSELPDSPQSDSDEDVPLFPPKRCIGRAIGLESTDWFGHTFATVARPFKRPRVVSESESEPESTPIHRSKKVRPKYQLERCGTSSMVAQPPQTVTNEVQKKMSKGKEKRVDTATISAPHKNAHATGAIVPRPPVKTSYRTEDGSSAKVPRPLAIRLRHAIDNAAGSTSASTAIPLRPPETSQPPLPPGPAPPLPPAQPRLVIASSAHRSIPAGSQPSAAMTSAAAATPSNPPPISDPRVMRASPAPPPQASQEDSRGWPEDLRQLGRSMHEIL